LIHELREKGQENMEENMKRMMKQGDVQFTQGGVQVQLTKKGK
jgi:hypothetical protein